MPGLSDVWAHYIKGPNKYKRNWTNFEVWCRYCVDTGVQSNLQTDQEAATSGLIPPFGKPSREAVRKEVISRLPALCGKVEDMWRHLSRCPYVPVDVKHKAEYETKICRPIIQRVYAQDLTFTPTNSQSNIHGFDGGLPMQPRMGTLGLTEDSIVSHQSFNNSQEWKEDICRLMVAGNVSWWVVDHPYWVHFFRKYIPGAELPGHQLLSGPVLSSLVGGIEEEMKLKVENRYGTGQCDGWKNIAKNSLIGSMINVEYRPYLLNTIDISSEAKTAETLLKIVKQELRFCTEVLKVRVVAWCSDASGESSSMRRMLISQHPSIVSVDCWAHQVNLIVGDYFKLQTPSLSIINKGLEIVKWFNNHSHALGLLRKVQIDSTGKARSLILPVITRWTSHCLSVCRLLDLEPFFHLLRTNSEHQATLLVCAGPKLEAKRKAEEVLQILDAGSFWDGLKMVRRHLEPLAVAANVTQGNAARLDVVLCMLGNLYHHFSNSSVDQTVRDGLLISLEKQWLKADQNVFILALVLNPYVRKDTFHHSSPFRTSRGLWDIFEVCFCRFFEEEPDLECEKAFEDYCTRTGVWNDSGMRLLRHEQRANQMNSHVNLVEIWRAHDTGEMNGSNGLVKLAMLILSIVPNSASTERLFSRLAVVHTKTRNRLKSKRACDTVLVRTDIEQKYGVPQARLSRKRKLVQDHTDSGSLEVEPSSFATNDLNPEEMGNPTALRQDTEELETEGDGEEDVVEIEEVPFSVVVGDLVEQSVAALGDVGTNEPTHAASVARPTFMGKEARLLRNMFNYSDSSVQTLLASGLSNPPSLGQDTQLWKQGGLDSEIYYTDFIYSQLHQLEDDS